MPGWAAATSSLCPPRGRTSDRRRLEIPGESPAHAVVVHPSGKGLVVITVLWAPLLGSVALIVLYAVGLIVYIKIKCQSPREAEWGSPPRCKQCGYELTGLSEPRCPECGKTTDLQVFE